MAMSRRQFLAGISAGVGVLVVGGGVYRATDQGVFASGTGPAFEAWDDWRTEPAEGPMRLVQSGILAANPHNTQPWFFRVAQDQIELYADTSRHLGAMDPYLREMYLGLGCAIENMMLTAPAVGYQAVLSLEGGQLQPPAAQPQMRKVAVLNLTAGENRSGELYAAIPQRHTNRYNYDVTRSIEPMLIDEMQSFSALEDDVRLFLFQRGSAEFDRFAESTVTSTETIISDHDMAYDSYRWVDQSWEELQEEKDGPYIDTSGSAAHIRAFVKMLPSVPQGQFDAGWLTNTEATMAHSDVLGFIAVPDLYDIGGALRAGRIWQRLHLWATVNGLAMQPINQMPEVVDRDRQLGRDSELAAVMDELTGEPAWRPTFAFRAGYPMNDVLPSARRPLEEVLV